MLYLFHSVHVLEHEDTRELLVRLYRLLTLLRASRDDARLEPTRFRFDVLAAFRSAVHQMAEGFNGATSGLQKLREAGNTILESEAFKLHKLSRDGSSELLPSADRSRS